MAKCGMQHRSLSLGMQHTSLSLGMLPLGGQWWCIIYDRGGLSGRRRKRQYVKFLIYKWINVNFIPCCSSLCSLLCVYTHSHHSNQRTAFKDLVLFPCESWRSNSGCQAGRQAPLPAEPILSAPCSISLLKLLCCYKIPQFGRFVDGTKHKPHNCLEASIWRLGGEGSELLCLPLWYRWWHSS